jgi:hypothetical protein
MILKKSIVNVGKVLCTVVKFNYNTQKDVEEDVSHAEVEVRCEGKEILYYTRRNTGLGRDSLKVSITLKARNYFYILSPGKDDFVFQINNQQYYSSKIKCEITEKQIENLLYALCYEEYSRGNSDRARDILVTSLADRYLSKNIINSFTTRERQSCMGLLFKAAHKRKVKVGPRIWKPSRLMEGTLSEGEVLTEGTCFMQLLEVFENNNDKFIPVHSNSYKRIGKKVMDNYNVFKIDKSERVTADFSDLVFTKEKLNISVRYEILGYITINPRQARAVGFETNVFKAKVFREQTIIRDGEINISKFKMLSSVETMKYLEKLKIKDLFRVLEKNDYFYEDYTLIELDITKLPILNKEYILKGDSLEYILDNTCGQRLAECRQKVLKYYIEKANKEVFCKKSTYTKEQIELLKTYSLDANGIYQGVDNKVVSEGADQYECKFFEFSLKGFSTLPKVEDVLSKMKAGSKKFNKPETAMGAYIKELTLRKVTENTSMLFKLLEEQKSIIKSATKTLAKVKLTKALTGSWWSGLKLDNRENYLYQRGDETLVVKVVKKVVKR